MSDVVGLLKRGYFPKELPPPFKTVSFGDAVDWWFDELIALSNKLPPARLAHHNLARPGNVYRRLGIPNPAKQLQLSAFVTERWSDLSKASSEGALSLSSPTVSAVGRYFNPKVLIGDLAEQRARIRAGKRYSLTADIARFYPSLYTHSIPWALHTKKTAKANRGSGLVGNVLDRLVRDSQDGQTVGVPIGPDTSLLIAEIVMCAADQQLAKRLDLNGFRYIDDIELTFSRASDADAALGPLQEVLSHFELALNPTKTQVEKLPLCSDEPWLARVRSQKIRAAGSQQRIDLISYFDVAFTAAKEFPAKTVLNYAVARLRNVPIHDENVGVVQDLILQALVNEAGVARFALELLIRYRAAGVSLDRDRLGAALSTIIHYHGPLLHSSEVAWALWAAIAFNIPLQATDVRLAVATDDPVIGLLALDAHNRGLVTFDLPSELSQVIGLESYRSERWLLLYEGVARGWLAKSKVLQDDEFTAFFEKLMELGVSFYDSDVELEKIDRVADKLHVMDLPVLGFVFGY